LLCVAAPFLGCFQTTHQMFSAIVPGGTARPSGFRETRSNAEIKSAWASEEKEVEDDTNQRRMFSRFTQLRRVRKDSVLESVKQRIFRADRVQLTCPNELAAGASDAAGKRDSAPHRQPCFCDACCPQRNGWKRQEPRKHEGITRAMEALKRRAEAPNKGPRQATFQSAFDRMYPFEEAARMETPETPQFGLFPGQLSEDPFQDIFPDEHDDEHCQDDDDYVDDVDDALGGRDFSWPNGVNAIVGPTTKGARSLSFGRTSSSSTAASVAGRAAQAYWSSG